MNKLIVLFTFLSTFATIQFAAAQAGVNSTQDITENQISAYKFIDGISFTPAGILKTPESGGSKSIKVYESPIIVKNNYPVVAYEPPSLIEKLTGIQYKYAMMIDVEIESLKDLTLFGFIDNWFGTRYQMGGDTKDGIDCSAFTSNLLLAVYGFVVPRTARQQYRSTRHIKKGKLKQGDLVFFNTHGGVSHVGLYLDNNYFVHSCSSQGVTISSLEDRYYAKRFICGGRVEQE